MGLAQLGDPLLGGSSAPGSLNTPAVGDTALTGVAQPYAAVQVYKGSSTTPIGTAFADDLGAWTLTLATAAALNDIFRTLAGGVIVIATGGGGTPADDLTSNFDDEANAALIPGLTA